MYFLGRESVEELGDNNNLVWSRADSYLKLDKKDISCYIPVISFSNYDKSNQINI